MKQVALGANKFGVMLESTSAPVGTVISYAGATLPNGWLKCDGSTFSETDYPELYAVLGTTTLPTKTNTFTLGYDIIRFANVSGLLSSAIDDTQTSVSTAWSSSKINDSLAEYHNITDFIGKTYYSVVSVTNGYAYIILPFHVDSSITTIVANYNLAWKQAGNNMSFSVTARGPYQTVLQTTDSTFVDSGNGVMLTLTIRSVS